MSKRKKEGVSGTIPPTRRPRTSVTVETVHTIKTTLTAHSSAELHEFDSWLQSAGANHTRKDHIDKDTRVVKDLLVQLPDMTILRSAAEHLVVHKSNRQTIAVWHARCLCFNFWKEFNAVRKLQTQVKPASRLLCDMFVVFLICIQEVSSFVSPYYHTHTLRLAPPSDAFTR